MKRLSCMLVTLVGLVALIIACGGSDNAGADGLGKYLPAGLAEQGLQKGAETRTFVGDSLWEYINGGAELYHSFGFVKVTTADYKSPQTELVLDLYQFESSEGAYGLYSSLRPDDPVFVALGVEGYFTGSSLEFVKGDIMVRLVAYDESEATEAALSGLAGKVAADLPGTIEPPEAFGLLPEENIFPGSDRMVGEAFLGQSFLNMVYQRDYLLGVDTVTLFLIDDAVGTSLAQWFEQVSEEERSPVSLVDLPFHESYYLLIANNYYGNILAGLKNGKLVGMINFSDPHQQFMSDWLSSLPAAP